VTGFIQKGGFTRRALESKQYKTLREVAPMANSSFIASAGWEKTGRAYELLEISLSEGLRDSTVAGAGTSSLRT